MFVPVCPLLQRNVHLLTCFDGTISFAAIWDSPNQKTEEEYLENKEGYFFLLWFWESAPERVLGSNRYFRRHLDTFM